MRQIKILALGFIAGYTRDEQKSDGTYDAPKVIVPVVCTRQLFYSLSPRITSEHNEPLAERPLKILARAAATFRIFVTQLSLNLQSASLLQSLFPNIVRPEQLERLHIAAEFCASSDGASAKTFNQILRRVLPQMVKLKSLSFVAAPISVEAFSSSSFSPHLTELSLLFCSDFGDAALERIANNIPSLKVLEIRGNNSITAQGMTHFYRSQSSVGQQQIESLSLSRVLGVNELNLLHQVFRFQYLKHLAIRACKLSEQDLKGLALCVELRSLSLHAVTGLTLFGFGDLGQMPLLRRLELSAILPADSMHFAALGQFASVEHLKIKQHQKFSLDDLAHVCSMPALQRLELFCDTPSDLVSWANRSLWSCCPLLESALIVDGFAVKPMSVSLADLQRAREDQKNELPLRRKVGTVKYF